MWSGMVTVEAEFKEAASSSFQALCSIFLWFAFFFFFLPLRQLESAILVAIDQTAVYQCFKIHQMQINHSK